MYGAVVRTRDRSHQPGQAFVQGTPSLVSGLPTTGRKTSHAAANYVLTHNRSTRFACVCSGGGGPGRGRLQGGVRGELELTRFSCWPTVLLGWGWSPPFQPPSSKADDSYLTTHGRRLPKSASLLEHSHARAAAMRWHLLPLHAEPEKAP